jgi:hypothetical protein
VIPPRNSFVLQPFPEQEPPCSRAEPSLLSADLPTSPARYVRRFSSQPTEIYHQGMIDVLTNDVRRVFLECSPERRVFDNVWTINGILIFKGSCVVFLFSPKLTCFQTFLESSRVKPSSVEIFQTYPLSCLAWSIQNPNLKRLGK